MVLYKSVPDADFLAEHVSSGTLRAAAEIAFGPYAGFGIATDETAHAAALSTRAACPGNPMDCIGLLLEAITRVQSPAEPGEYNLFAFLEIHAGRLEEYKRAVLERGSAPDGVEDAVAFAYGAPGVHVVVEVVGDVLADVGQRLRELLDVESVKRFDTAVISRERAFGWARPEASVV